MHKVIVIIFLFIFTPQFAFAENYNGEWRFESNNKKCSNFFKWDNTKIIIKNNKATYSISNTNGWSHEYIGKLKSNKKLNMNGLDASISGKFISNNQLEIKFTNIRETWEWVNMLSKCTATFTNAKDSKSLKKLTKDKNANDIFFCKDIYGQVFKRSLSVYNDCGYLTAINEEEYNQLVDPKEEEKKQRNIKELKDFQKFIGSKVRVLEYSPILTSISDSNSAGGSTGKARVGEEMIIRSIERSSFQNKQSVKIGKHLLVDGIYACVINPNRFYQQRITGNERVGSYEEFRQFIEGSEQSYYNGCILLDKLKILDEIFFIPLDCELLIDENGGWSNYKWFMDSCKKNKAVEEIKKEINNITLDPIPKPKF
jgi:hypothetical protein